MPPKIKFQEEDIVKAAMNITQRKGIEAVTAREVASELGGSTRPIFNWFATIEELKAEVYNQARLCYRNYIQEGLRGPRPFLGVGQQYIRFAREKTELYKLLFLRKPSGVSGGAIDTMKYSQDLVRESIMEIYHLDASAADNYFRNLWLVAYGFATLIVTDDCPYTDQEISNIFSEISLAICKAYKEVPGLVEGNYDKDGIFKELVNK